MAGNITTSLWTGAEILCKESHVTKENEYFHDIFVANVYPEEMVKKFTCICIFKAYQKEQAEMPYSL